jgi:uncharacterized membrane protein YqjE
LSQTVGLAELVTKLIGGVGQLIDQRLELLRAELKRDAANVARSLGMLAAGAVGLGAGAILLLLALGLWVGDLVGSTPGGLAIVGGGLALAGVGLGLLARKNMERQRLARDTLRELRRDVEWIRHEV